ncbi:MAG: hypothetical protein ABEH64_13085 [Salinirussus sp.]
MVSTVLAAVAGMAMLVILGTVLGAVHRRERLLFVPGILLIVLGPLLAGALPGAAAVGMILGVVGAAAVLGSTIPLLRESARTG